MTDDIQALIDSAPVLAAQPRFHVLRMSEVRTMPRKQWLVQDVVGAGDLCMVYGAPGAGKSFVVLDLLVAAIKGVPFAGFAIERPLTVVYAAGEGGSGVRDRLVAAIDAQEVTPEEEARIVYVPDVPQLYDGSSALSPAAFAADLSAAGVPKADLVVIDTLHTATIGSEENSASDAGRVIGAAKQIAKALGCAVVIVHHSNRGGTGERGSSAYRGACDCMVEVGKTEGGDREMRCRKLKDGEEWPTIPFSLIDAGPSAIVGWGSPGKTRASMAGDAPYKPSKSDTAVHQAFVRTAPEWVSLADLERETGLARATARDAAKRLVARGCVEEKTGLGRNGSLYRNTIEEPPVITIPAPKTIAEQIDEWEEAA